MLQSLAAFLQTAMWELSEWSIELLQTVEFQASALAMRWQRWQRWQHCAMQRAMAMLVTRCAEVGAPERAIAVLPERAIAALSEQAIAPLAVQATMMMKWRTVIAMSWVVQGSASPAVKTVRGLETPGWTMAMPWHLALNVHLELYAE